MEEVFEPITENQKQNQTKQQELSGEQIQALHDSTRATSQTTTQAMHDQTRAIRESSNALNKNIQKSIKEGVQEYDEIRIAIIKYLRVLLIPTKLIPVL